MNQRECEDFGPNLIWTSHAWVDTADGTRTLHRSYTHGRNWVAPLGSRSSQMKRSTVWQNKVGKVKASQEQHQGHRSKRCRPLVHEMSGWFTFLAHVQSLYQGCTLPMLTACGSVGWRFTDIYLLLIGWSRRWGATPSYKSFFTVPSLTNPHL